MCIHGVDSTGRPYQLNLVRGTGMIASCSTFRPHPGRVIRDMFRQLHAVWHGTEALVYSNHPSNHPSCSLLVSGHNFRTDCLVPLLNCGANAALASVLALL